MLAEVEDFDQDPELLNVANGVVDLRTGELLDHDPDLLMRHRTDVAYRPGATHPDWDTALQALPDTETTMWVQQYLASGITGYTPREDVVTFWHGGGSNGKSTLLGAVQAAVGQGYSKPCSPRCSAAGATNTPPSSWTCWGPVWPLWRRLARVTGWTR